MVLFRHLRLPALFDHDGLMRLDENCGTGYVVARRELVTDIDRRIAPGAPGKEARAPFRWGYGRRHRRQYGLGKFRPASDRFDRDGFNDEFLRRIDKAEPRLMGRFEGGAQVGEGGVPLVAFWR